MASLLSELSGRLDVSSLVEGFLSDPDGALDSLGGISDPTPTDQVQGIQTELESADAGPLQGAVRLLEEGATSLLAALPVAGDVVKPVTDALALVETLVANPELGNLEETVRALLGEAAGVLEGPRENGALGALHAVAGALNDAPATALVTSLLSRITAAAGVNLPSLPVADAIGALDGSVRIVGGLMVLASVTADVERLTRLMNQRLDPRVLDRELAALDAALGYEGGELAAAVASVDPADRAALQRMAVRVAAAAAALDHVREEYAAAMAFGEATLVYLDVDALAGELGTGRTLIRTADLEPLNRMAQRLAGGLSPFLRQDLLAGPRQDLDALFTTVEGQIAQVADRIAGFDVAALVQPLDDGLHLLTTPVDRLRELLDQVRLAYQGALGAVRDAVAALPVQTIVDAVQGVLAPIGRAVAAIRQVIEDVLELLAQAAADTKAGLAQVEGAVDHLKELLDGVFGEAKAFIDSLHLDQALGAVEENIRKVAALLEKARMEPYFATAADAIEAAAGVISKVPFDLLPDSMESDVADAVAPIKNANAGALATEIESLLQITPDGHFAILADVDAALASLQAGFDSLMAEVRAHEPRAALATVDTKLGELAEQIRQLEPAVTLQPVRDALDQVKAVLASLDLDALLQPVRDAFATVTSTVEQFRPSELIGGLETRITAVREQVVTLLRLPQIAGTLDTLHAQATALLDRYDADLLQQRLELVLQEFIDLADRTPRLQLMGGAGAVVAGLVNGMGLRTYPGSFDSVLRWLQGESAAAELNGRVVRAGAAVAATRDLVAAFDLGGRVAPIAARVLRLRDALATVQASLPADAPRALAGAAPRLDAAAVFGSLEVNRARYAEALRAAADRIQAITQDGFSDADVRVADLKAALAPLDPARAYARQLLQQLGLPGLELGLGGVLRAVLALIPPARLVGLVRPILEALRGRVQALLDGVITPVKDAVARLQAALDAIDLAPLMEALDGVHAEVLAKIQALSPDTLLGPTLGELTALRQALLDADPLAAITEILNSVRDTVVKVLGKLSLEYLLEIPLALFDELLAILARLDFAALIKPLRDQLDDIAAQVDAGLDRTVTAFERLQDSLPEAGGGGSASAEADVSVAVA